MGGYSIPIYIPLWLDLLLAGVGVYTPNASNLHSTMVRFIIELKHYRTIAKRRFTFHYG